MNEEKQNDAKAVEQLSDALTAETKMDGFNKEVNIGNYSISLDDGDNFVIEDADGNVISVPVSYLGEDSTILNNFVEANNPEAKPGRKAL